MKTISVEELAQKLADANRTNTDEPWTIQAARVAIEAMSPNPRSPDVENEIAEIRADITRTSSACLAVKPVYAFEMRDGYSAGYYPQTGDEKLHRELCEKLKRLLAKEQELMNPKASR